MWGIKPRFRNKFGFQIIRQRGSHVLIKKGIEEGKIGTVIPMHKELKIGTLKAILEQARISVEEFCKFV
ncbi:type II toxin-antitoxin system HicA family toxin [Candidatus Pacearchaeota archaeon]|nr:type II toxin-antitoxin system HicA family toxin [Candidatus Pacearchaeota archaeon]